MLYKKNWEEYTYYLQGYLKEERKSSFRAAFFQLHWNDQLRFFNQLEKMTRSYFYQYVEAEEVAPLFAKLSLVEKELVISEIEDSYERALLESLLADEMERFLKQLNASKRQGYLAGLSQNKAEQIEWLLSYHSGTAGALMTTEFVTAEESETVGDVLDRLFTLGKYRETIYYIYILSERKRLIGVVLLRDLIIVPHGHTMKFVMKKQVVSVRPEMDEQQVITIIKDYDLLLIPVVTAEDEMLGIITVDDVLDIKEDKRTKAIAGLLSEKFVSSLVFIVFIMSLVLSIWLG